MTSLKTEVLVIGAGPGGSIAASILARAGKKVLVLEGGTFPRFQIGESMLPRVNDILEEAGLLQAVQAKGFMPKPGALFLAPDGSSDFFSFADMFPGQRPAAMQVTRADFDQLLATEARRFGADVRFQQRVDAVEVSAAGAHVKATDVETNETYSVEAKFLIDCSGYGRVLPRLLKLEKDSVLSPRCAIMAHFENDERPKGEGAEAPGNIWVNIHPEGPWTWIIPFANGRTSVGVVVPHDQAAKAGKTDRERLEYFMRTDPNTQRRFKNGVQVMKTVKLEGWSAAVTAFHGPGWAVTGNASEFLDPIFSSGVTLALESASRAAKLAVRQLDGEPVDWNKEYTPNMERAVGVFRAFVQAWYRGDLQKVLLFPGKGQKIKQAITSVLGGYVLDERNPFVTNPEGTLGACLKMIG